MPKKRVGQVIVEALEEAGAKRCYGIPGDTLNHITDPLRISGRIEWVLVRHEEVGGFAAGADALLTGQLTACAGTCGPGSLHFVNGLFGQAASTALYGAKAILSGRARDVLEMAETNLVR